MLICTYCNSKLSNKSSLNCHQKTAKYCLKLQNKDIDYKCKYCGKNLSCKRRLEQHINACKTKDIENLQKQINNLEKN